MAGLTATVEERAAQVAALVRELNGYEQRVAAAHIDKDDVAAEKWETRAEQVRRQLELRGHAASSPHRRASKRDGRAGQEVRA